MPLLVFVPTADEIPNAAKNAITQSAKTSRRWSPAHRARLSIARHLRMTGSIRYSPSDKPSRSMVHLRTAGSARRDTTSAGQDSPVGAPPQARRDLDAQPVVSNFPNVSTGATVDATNITYRLIVR
jgi:hypothetical protein